MKNVALFGLIVLFSAIVPAKGQYWIGDHWYDNPLGFEPVKLHTSMGFIVPAVAVGVCLLLTEKDTALVDRFSLYNEAGFAFGYKYPYTFLTLNSSGVNFYLRKWMSIGVELDEYFPIDNYNSTVGFAIRPFARFYPVNTEQWRLYFELGGGLIYLFDYFPKPTEQDNRLGTKLNGTTKYGIGSEYTFSKSVAISFSIKHIHISNGNTNGVERNPSHDSNGFFIGVVYSP